MAQLDSIKPSISDLTPNDAILIVRNVRESRLRPKAPPSKAAGKRKEARKDVLKTIANLTPEQAAKLIEKLTK